MESQEFISNAIKTESRVGPIVLGGHDMRALMHLLQASVQVAKALDNFKRHIYYGKELDRVRFTTASIDAASHLKVAASDVGIGGMESYNHTPVHRITNDPRVVHGIIGMFGECGELIEALLLSESDQKVLDRVNVAEEIGDTDWYKAVLLDATGLDEGAIRQAVIAKLKKRYGEKFSEVAATNRDIAGERAVLESKVTS